MRRLVWEKLRAGGDFWRIFSVSGSVMLQTLDSEVPEPESSFKIHGDGLVVRDGSSDEVFESTFQIADPGTGKYLALKIAAE